MRRVKRYKVPEGQIIKRKKEEKAVLQWTRELMRKGYELAISNGLGDPLPPPTPPTPVEIPNSFISLGIYLPNTNEYLCSIETNEDTLVQGKAAGLNFDWYDATTSGSFTGGTFKIVYAFQKPNPGSGSGRYLYIVVISTDNDRVQVNTWFTKHNYGATSVSLDWAINPNSNLPLPTYKIYCCEGTAYNTTFPDWNSFSQPVLFGHDRNEFISLPTPQQFFNCFINTPVIIEQFKNFCGWN